jgi:hypothetical protein
MKSTNQQIGNAESFGFINPPLRGARAAPACLLLGLLCCGVAGSARAQGARRRSPRAEAATVKAPKVVGAKASAAASAGTRLISFTLTVWGEGFGQSAGAVSLALLDTDGEDAVESERTKVESVEDSKIVFRVAAPPGSYRLRLKVGASSADTSLAGPVTVSLRPTLSPINIEEPEVSAYPSDGGLRKYAVVVKRKGGEFFGTDPNLVSLTLAPAGASDITIRRVTPTRIEADFRAPDKFKVEEAAVSIYDGKNRQLAVASSDLNKPSKAPKPEEADPPEISSTSVVFLQRAYGIGRLKIEGKNFGDYEAPPMTAEDYLLCFEPRARQALAEGASSNAGERQRLEDKRCKNPGTTPSKWNAWREKIEERVKVVLVPRDTERRVGQTKILYIDDKLIDVYFEFDGGHPLRLASATVAIKREVERKAAAQAGAATEGSGKTAGDSRDGVSVINEVVAGGQPPPDKSEIKTYVATKEVGTKQDENLEYRYTVLDNASAATLFGKGVAQNFYVVQLSVTNNGDRKVAVPLTSIQAEVEWAYGPDDAKAPDKSGEKPAEAGSVAAQGEGTKGEGKKDEGRKGEGEIPDAAGDLKEYYEEGPATLAPLPLPAVTAFFDADQKTSGTKAKLFNAFEGATIFATSLVPFLGEGFLKGELVFTGGVVPGLRRALGDLSGQQLQNLAALSWQNVEVVSAGGGSVEKFVFIQRRDQFFSTGSNGPSKTNTIRNISGIEVVGFELTESDAKSATPADKQ